MKFQMTREGCKAATKWLKENGRYEEFENNSFSVDGYSLVHWANHYYEKTPKGMIDTKPIFLTDPARSQSRK